mgnify:CR=1 FL=1
MSITKKFIYRRREREWYSSRRPCEESTESNSKYCLCVEHEAGSVRIVGCRGHEFNALCMEEGYKGMAFEVVKQ